MISLGLRTFVRYLVPLALLAVIVCAPLVLVAFSAPWPQNPKTANVAIGRAFAIAALAWIPALVLVGAAAPLARSLAAGAPLSQPRALYEAFANTVRMALPCLAACVAIAVGGLALVVPAFLLMALLALTGASTERGISGPLADSAAHVRAHWKPVVAIVVAMIVVDLALALVAWKVFAVPFDKKLKAVQYAPYGSIARIVALGVLATTPVFASLFAAVRARASA